MARIKKSAIGELSGKAGELVFKTGKYGNYVSSLPVRRKDKPSAVQQLQRNKMTVVMEFMKSFQWAFKDYYFPFQQNKSGFHAAKSYYLQEALQFENEAYQINFSKALLTYGDLRMIEHLELTPDTTAHTLSLQWANNSQQAMAYADDALLLLVYAPETGQRFQFLNLARRADETAVCVFNTHSITDYHLWVSFVQPEQKRASPSVYAGLWSV